MSAADDLEAIADEMAGILSRFSRTRDGTYIAEGDEANFTRLVLEVREILSEALGTTSNSFGVQLEGVRRQGTVNFTGSQSYHSVDQAVGIVRAAVNSLRRRAAKPSQPLPGVISAPPYVSLSRINEIRAISSPSWDLKRLIRLCEEINSSFAAGNYLATGMLLRAVADHIPPIFGAGNFGQYASSIASRSLKGSMEHLQGSLRNIADSLLHEKVRRKEVLPTASQVDFRQDLDVLLGEVVRVLHSDDR